jgi:hypothetical protein
VLQVLVMVMVQSSQILLAQELLAQRLVLVLVLESIQLAEW